MNTHQLIVSSQNLYVAHMRCSVAQLNEESLFQTCTLDSELSVSGAAVWRGPPHTHKHLNSNGKVTDRHATTVRWGGQ